MKVTARMPICGRCTELWYTDAMSAKTPLTKEMLTKCFKWLKTIKDKELPPEYLRDYEEGGPCRANALLVMKILEESGVSMRGLKLTNSEDLSIEEDLDVFDMTKLKRVGEPIPDALKKMPAMPSHTWLRFQGKHYDIWSPSGVEHFLDLLPYKRRLKKMR